MRDLLFQIPIPSTLTGLAWTSLAWLLVDLVGFVSFVRVGGFSDGLGSIRSREIYSSTNANTFLAMYVCMNLSLFMIYYMFIKESEGLNTIV